MGVFVVCVVAIAVVLAAVMGAMAVRWRRARGVHGNPDEAVQPHRLGADALGENATLLQFSTRTCARCPGVHHTLAAVARGRSGVLHLDVDLTHRPDIARHFQVLQTPTTLVLDSRGIVQTRFGGIPGRGVVEFELSRLAAQPRPQ